MVSNVIEHDQPKSEAAGIKDELLAMWWSWEIAF